MKTNKNSKRRNELDLGLNKIGDNPRNRKVYLIISDLHIPYEIKEIDEYVSKFEGYCDELIIAGDFLDQYAVSSFVKDKYVSLKTELIRGHRYLKKWSKMFNKIHMIEGNHEQRLGKYFHKSLSSDTLFLIGENICLNKFKTGFSFTSENEDNFDEVLHFEPIENLIVYNERYIKLGDAMVGHPIKFSRKEGKTVETAFKTYRLYDKDIKAMIIGHTHQIYRTISDSILNNDYMLSEDKEDILLMEIGCNCIPQPYAQKDIYRPQVNALAVLVLDDDKVNTSMTRYHLIKDL